MRKAKRAGFNKKPILFAGFNGASVGGTNYKIGFAYSLDQTNWSTYGGSLIQLSASGWDSNTIKDPSLIWDGTQFVCYYGGYNGTNFAIGRATAAHPSGPWYKYASNPVLSKGTTGDPDEVGCEFPIVWYDANDTPKYRMWYVGYPSGFSSSTNPIGTVCHADSADGITWTKRGTVIGRGAASSFNEIASIPGAVTKSGSTWYVYLCGMRATDFIAKSAYATTTSPASSASYSALTQFTNYTGNITVGGKTWQSNLPRGILSDGAGGYRCWIDLWKPTDTTTILETCAQVTSTDLTSWATPSALMLPFDSWSAVSSENPSILVAP